MSNINSVSSNVPATETQRTDHKNNETETYATEDSNLKKSQRDTTSECANSKRRVDEICSDSKDEQQQAEQPNEHNVRKENITKKRARKNRCAECQCRLSLVWQSIKCRCGLSFCEKHRHPVLRADRFDISNPTGHLCSFDYAEEAQKSLGKTMVRVDTNSGLKTRL